MLEAFCHIFALILAVCSLGPRRSLPFAVTQGDAVVTDVEGVKAAVERCGAENVLCVVTTTSCFAPRLPDKVRVIVSKR